MNVGVFCIPYSQKGCTNAQENTKDGKSLAAAVTERATHMELCLVMFDQVWLQIAVGISRSVPWQHYGNGIQPPTTLSTLR